MKNRRYSYLFFVLLVGPFCTAQTVSTDKNAVIHYQARTATTNPNTLVNNYQNAAVTIQYMDGLGRPVQTVGYRATPTGKDLLQQSSQYDNYGRQERVYLPSPATSTSGGYQTNALSLGQGFYNGDTHPYNQINQFDNSPLNRVKQNYGAGQAWQTNNKYTQTFYETAGSDVRRYTLNSNGNVDLSGVYSNNSLYKTRQIDEQGHTSIEIKDKQGRLVERHQQDDSGFMVTHYLYDGLDRPVAIIQPQGYALNSGFVKNSINYQNYVFAYEYDVRGRIGRKHIPGGGWTSFVYDKTDRPVLEQSEHQAQSNRWSFVKYDAFGRVILTGELVNGNDRTTLQGSFDGVSTPFETWNGSNYTSQSFPISHNTTDIRQTNYYDSYNGWRPLALQYESNGAYNSTAHYPNATGLMTGSETRSTEDNTKTFLSVMYYDNRSRVVQTYQTHHKGGANLTNNPIRTDYEYNFAGEIIKEKKTYKADGEAERVKTKTYLYDHVGRKTACDLNIGNINERLANYEFDEIGRLSRKVFLPNGNFIYGGAKDYILRPGTDGAITQNNTQDIARKAVVLEPVNVVDAVNLTSYTATIDPNAPTGIPITGLQKVNYNYHIRGGLLGINLDGSGNPALATPEADLFAYKLDYETAGFYDGNIGKETWKSAKNTGTNRSYTYSYDPAKRLKSATYSGGMFANESYTVENINYDKNGNIQTFWRKGMTGANGNSFGYVDQMQYFYSGNRLNGITDAVNGNLDVSDFRDNGSNSDYTYHPDGSLKSDDNRNISLIEWDTFLKKLRQITYTNGDWIKHFYDGGGKRFKTEDSEGTIWEYVDDLIYKNGQLYQINDDEGRILFENGNYVYEFNYKDHLGNIRVSFKAVGNQLIETQENAYYPFGLSHTGTDFTLGVNANNFQYNGKEKVNSFNLNVSDYGFRTHDFLTNRFWSVDPLGESFAHNGVYNYAENRPIDGIDLEGLEFYRTVDKDIATIGAKVKFSNSSGASKERVDAIKNAVNTTFNRVIESSGSGNKGEIIFDENATLNLTLDSRSSSILGIGGLNTAIMTNEERNGNPISVEEVANTGVHEILHLIGLNHPQDFSEKPAGSGLAVMNENNAPDTKLTIKKGSDNSFQFFSTPQTVKNIHYNIMVYGSTPIDGKRAREVRGSNANATALTPDQRKIIEENIKKGLVNGEASLQN